MLPYFVFKGIDSRDMGILINDISPIVRPARRVNEVEIAGRHGVLHEDEETFENYTKDIKCSIINHQKRVEHSAIGEWLMGAGELIVSSEPDKIYRVYIKNQIAIADVLKTVSTFMIQLDTFPFKYSVNKHDELVSLSKNSTLYYDGGHYSEPIITVYGSGTIQLIINSEVFTLNGVSGHITINSEIMEVYKDSENQNIKYSAGGFPILVPGKNTISFTGTVSKVDVYINRRWL